jgi:hypothetical protein
MVGQDGRIGGEEWQEKVPYFLAYKMHQPIRRTLIFSLEILQKFC